MNKYILFLFMLCTSTLKAQKTLLSGLFGFWVQVPSPDLAHTLLENNYFDFQSNGSFTIFVDENNNTTTKKIGEGVISVIKQESTNKALVLINLNEEVSTNLLSVTDKEIRIFSFDEKSKPFEKLVLKRTQRPTK